MQDQVSFMQRQIEESKAMHEAVMSALNQRGTDKEKDDK